MNRSRRFVAAVLLGAGAAICVGMVSPGPVATLTVHAVVERAAAVQGPGPADPGRPVSGLRAEDFEIWSDDQQVPVASFAPEDGPVALFVLVDVSASLEIEVGWLLEPLEKFLVPALVPGDAVAFGRFGGTGLNLDSAFSTDRQAIQAAARKTMAAREVPRPEDLLEFHPSLLVGARNGAFGLGASPAWDAVYDAVSALESQDSHRAIVLLTDGRSTGNRRGIAEASLHAVSRRVSVSVVGLAEDGAIPQGGTAYARVRPSVFLRWLADLTGGGYAELTGSDDGRRPSPRDSGALKRSVGGRLAQFVNDLHTAYRLEFVPPVLDGGVHRLEVRVRKPGHTVRAMQAYVAPSATRAHTQGSLPLHVERSVGAGSSLRPPR